MWLIFIFNEERRQHRDMGRRGEWLRYQTIFTAHAQFRSFVNLKVIKRNKCHFYLNLRVWMFSLLLQGFFHLNNRTLNQSEDTLHLLLWGYWPTEIVVEDLDQGGGGQTCHCNNHHFWLERSLKTRAIYHFHQKIFPSSNTRTSTAVTNYWARMAGLCLTVLVVEDGEISWLKN